MKKLELQLKKELLIVDLEDDSAGFINGDYEFLCEGSGLTEEIASELVENKTKHKFENKVLTFYNCKNLESFISEVESKRFYWLENPFKDWRSDGEIHDDDLDLIHKEAEEKTFHNPLIFVKKS